MRNLIFLFSLCSILSFSACNNDPCDNTICLNGGICESGDCVCPTGWTGADCSEAVTITYSKILITKIELLDYYLTRGDGSPWDANDEPDIFLGLWNTGNSSPGYDYTTLQIPNQGTPPLIYTPNTPYSIDLKDDLWNIAVNDKDANEDEWICSVNNFKFETYIANYPTEIIIKNHACEFKLHVEYID